MPYANGASGAEFYFVLAAIGIVAYCFCRNRKAMLLAVMLAIVAVPLLKSVMGEDRPCSGLLACPDDSGMPSGHTAFAFIFAAGSLGSPVFWFFFPAAALIAGSRLYLGAHTMAQVASGAGLGVALFFISKEILVAIGHAKRGRVHWRVKRFVRRRRLALRRTSARLPQAKAASKRVRR